MADRKVYVEVKFNLIVTVDEKHEIGEVIEELRSELVGMYLQETDSVIEDVPSEEHIITDSK